MLILIIKKTKGGMDMEEWEKNMLRFLGLHNKDYIDFIDIEKLKKEILNNMGWLIENKQEALDPSDEKKITNKMTKINKEAEFEIYGFFYRMYLGEDQLLSDLKCSICGRVYNKEKDITVHLPSLTHIFHEILEVDTMVTMSINCSIGKKMIKLLKESYKPSCSICDGFDSLCKENIIDALIRTNRDIDKTAKLLYTTPEAIRYRIKLYKI